ncbi:MAG: hypothetical protein FGM37_04940 [Phycisphaerales bacterium]|nr:hypothetical protein [Phycisphaerales bacterium]
MGDGGSLEHRIRFIMSGLLHRRPSLSVRLATAAVAAVSMAAGVACVSASASSQGAAPANPDGAPAAAATPASSQDGALERTLQATLDDPKSLDVEVENGSITVVRDDSLKSMQVTVVVGDRSDGRSDSDSYRAAVQGAALVAERDSSGQVKIRVNLPGLGLFRSNHPSTKVTVRTPVLSSVRAESMNGSIRTEGDLGKLVLETMNGSIDAAGAASVVEADSNNGSISIAGTMTSVKAETTNGSVDISGVMSSARAETANGKIRIAVPEGSKAVIDAESVNGGITLEIPASWDGAIDASTTNGRLRITDIDGTTTPDVIGATFRREAASGSPAKAKLDVANGPITLKRS